jgi:ribosomal subunit interface protein
VDVVVQGRHCAVTDRFRRHVEEKLTRLERFTSRVIRIEVEVSKEHTRSASSSERVELTVYSRGPLVRAEAAAADRFTALDLALDKLIARLRKAADRRRVHHGSRTPISVARATADLDPTATPVRSMNGLRGSGGAESDASGEGESSPAGAGTTTAEAGHGARAGTDVQTGTTVETDTGVGMDTGAAVETDTQVETVAGIQVEGDGPLVVREKVHRARPMTLDQALYEMELVGHDFYLFIDAATQRPSVVYRRRGYDYGVIRLECAVTEVPAASTATS